MHRLRDLSRRHRVVGLVLVLLVLAPFATSLAKAADVHWLPSGDDALIGLRTHDVFTAERPLVGQPSTSHLYGPEEGTAHPGPIEFYWLATPLRLLGPAAGMLAGIAAVNAAAVLCAAFAVFRRAGPAVGAWSLVLLGALLWAEGTALLSDPISSNAGGISLVALAALAWAVVDGDHRLLPVAAVFGSWVAQQHLAIVAPAIGLVGWAVVGVGAPAAWRWWSRRSAVAEEAVAVDDEAVEAAPPDRVWPWVAGAAAVGLACWSPVIYQQLTGHPGNVTAVIEYARTSESPSLGWSAGWRQAIRAVGLRPLLTREAETGFPMHRAPLPIGDQVVGVLTYLVLIATVVLARGRNRALALLAATTLVLAAAGTFNGSTIPASVEANRINFYRWMFVVAWLAWITLGWVAVLGFRAALERWRLHLPAPARRFGPPAAGALAAVALLAFAVGGARSDGYNDLRRDQNGFPAMRTVSAAAIDVAEGSGRVTLVLRGRSAVLASGPALTLQLTDAGHHVVLPEQEARFYGEQRILAPGDDPGDLVLQLVTGRGTVPAGPGEVVSRVDMNAELRSALAPLIAQAEGITPVLSPQADAAMAAHSIPNQRAYLAELLGAIGRDPEPVLTQPTLRAILLDGYFAAPSFDRDALAALDDLPGARTVNDDDVFELRILTRAELAEVVPSWVGPDA